MSLIYAIVQEEKPINVKIEGRRRLCKVLSRDKENTEGIAATGNEPGFADIIDFDLPLPSKTMAGGKRNQGTNEKNSIIEE